jgi:transcriptional regulator with XRE-family HTH domain
LRATLADNFRRIRQHRRLTQRQIAGVAQKTVSAVELATLNPTLSTISRLADGLGVSVAVLLTKSETEPGGSR